MMVIWRAILGRAYLTLALLHSFRTETTGTGCTQQQIPAQNQARMDRWGQVYLIFDGSQNVRPNALVHIKTDKPEEQ
jgi:uncharacterized membrane protein YvbJ